MSAGWMETESSFTFLTNRKSAFLGIREGAGLKILDNSSHQTLASQ